MPNWLITTISVILGSSVLGVILNHKLQQQREREKEMRAAHAALVACQRELCLGLLDLIIRLKTQLSILESVHDNRAARLTMKTTLQLSIQDMAAAMEPIRKVRRELDLAPNAQLQEAIDRFGDAGIAYQQELVQPMSSPWNPIQFYMGKAPKEEISRLAGEFYARTAELQEAVRSHMTRLEHPDVTKHVRWAFWRHKSK